MKGRAAQPPGGPGAGKHENSGYVPEHSRQETTGGALSVGWRTRSSRGQRDERSASDRRSARLPHLCFCRLKFCAPRYRHVYIIPFPSFLNLRGRGKRLQSHRVSTTGKARSPDRGSTCDYHPPASMSSKEPSSTKKKPKAGTPVSGSRHHRPPGKRLGLTQEENQRELYKEEELTQAIQRAKEKELVQATQRGGENERQEARERQNILQVRLGVLAPKLGIARPQMTGGTGKRRIFPKHQESGRAPGERGAISRTTLPDDRAGEIARAKCAPPICDHHHPEDLPHRVELPPANLPHPTDPPIRPISPSKPMSPTVPTIPTGPVMPTQQVDPSQQTNVNVQPTTGRSKRKRAREPALPTSLYVNVDRNTADLAVLRMDLAALRMDVSAIRAQMDRMIQLLERFPAQYATGSEGDGSLMEG